MTDDFLNKPLSLASPPGKWIVLRNLSTNCCSTCWAASNLSFFQTAPTPGVSEPHKITPLSPYLNYDPRFLQQAQPEFIFPEGASKQRGRFELAFSQIGSSVMVGAGIGGLAGLYNGIRCTAAANQTGKLRRTQWVAIAAQNHVSELILFTIRL